MALKLDMCKAYNRVEWPFIKGMMLKLGFADSFINFIIHCISSVYYSVLLNRVEGPTFKPSRGLRQEDLLSPYLFLFCGEGLSALMRLAYQEKKISRVKICRLAPPITHLMFADDCILFRKVSNGELQVIKDILREYEACSGQCINFKKSTAFFSSNMSKQDKDNASQIFNVRRSTEAERYLGLPNMVGRKKKLAFQVLKVKLKKKVDSWSVLYLSQGGKEGWRLLRNPDSLLARMLKAKYYKDLDFLKSRLGNLPSLTWQSVWCVKGLLLKGMGWRIGSRLGSTRSVVVIAYFRRRYIHEGEIKSGSQMVDVVCNYIKELDGLKTCLSVKQFHLSKWVAPMNSWLKINFDAGFNKDNLESCSGLVVRNERADLVCSKMIFHENIPTAFAIEAMVCLQVIHLGLYLGIRKVEIEGDSRTVIRKLQEDI
ncbi:hypothetical protein J1N35_046061 [Gossypium stocksii]|uniref:Reverse transcriptase domain-containing protein n=1 Tax=Gossypium stocksii TaxID=47602 RepID=A0A9D3ZDZ8_9ROSI|nr:hypothetical protein J1N35_046061 [Gossypium stocksii]